MKVDLDALDALEQRATPGEWRIKGKSREAPIMAGDEYVHERGDYYPSALSDEDAMLVVAIRNAAPDLIAVAKAAVVMNDAWDCSEDVYAVAERNLRAAVRAMVGEE